MSKAGNRLLRTTLIRATDNARRQDPQLAKIYYTQMVERGADHLKACCVVAAHLAERLHAVLVRAMPYVVCDTDGTPVDPATAKQLIAEHWTVPREVRARRRTRKTTSTTEGGEGPQHVLTGHGRSDPPKGRQTRRPSPHRILLATRITQQPPARTEVAGRVPTGRATALPAPPPAQARQGPAGQRPAQPGPQGREASLRRGGPGLPGAPPPTF